MRCARGTQAGDRDDDSSHLRAAKHIARSALHILPAEARHRARDAAPRAVCDAVRSAQPPRKKSAQGARVRIRA